MSRIYCYVITHDSGFAPNPFGGVLTLATCKPVIRRTARSGSWLVGTGSAAAGLRNKLIYAARIDNIRTIEEYGHELQYSIKRPSLSESDVSRHGDSIYFKDQAGEWRQRRNIHHDKSHTGRDLSGQNVLIASMFWYFGSQAKELPLDLLEIVKAGPGHKCTTSPEVINRLETWLSQFEPGIIGQSNASGLGTCSSC